MAAENGEVAVEICESSDQPIDVLLTDVIMPKMLGTELLTRIRELRPGIGVLFMSGYSHAVLAPGALADQPVTAFIEKPFNSHQLLSAVRRMLDECRRGESG
jgi:DNA-binding NtrC family response regulator